MSNDVIFDLKQRLEVLEKEKQMQQAIRAQASGTPHMSRRLRDIPAPDLRGDDKQHYWHDPNKMHLCTHDISQHHKTHGSPEHWTKIDDPVRHNRLRDDINFRMSKQNWNGNFNVKKNTVSSFLTKDTDHDGVADIFDPAPLNKKIKNFGDLLKNKNSKSMRGKIW